MGGGCSEGKASLKGDDAEVALAMKSLIEVINKLQDVFASVGKRRSEIELPQIVVVGSQSSGKSSVLEAFVGRDFLPRGSGIVTRRPLILQLIHCDDALEWAEFGHEKGREYTDFDQVRETIERETDRITGTNKGISDEPISLKVYSSNVVNLTLVDLPGMTKVAVGDQPANIEDQIRKMILRYISNQNSIILAVTPANQDFATSEALKMAREVDPDGLRTLAVLTKLDLMDEGTDAMDVLCGRVISVKLGIVGVVNRSQKDINEKKPIEEALDYERSFFQDMYSPVAASHGTPFLAKRLSELLMYHINERLPELRARVSEKKMQVEKELLLYGDPIQDKPGMLLTVIQRFSTAYDQAIEGTAFDSGKSEMCGGAKICRIFHEFSTCLDAVDAMQGLTDADILIALRNAAGLCPPLLVPESSFKVLVRKQIDYYLKGPSLMCVEMVRNELLRIADHCYMREEWKRFPKMHGRLNVVLRNILVRPFDDANYFVANLILAELAYINTNHPDFDKSLLCEHLKDMGRDSTNVRPYVFTGTRSKFSAESDLGNFESVPVTPRERRDCKIIEGLIRSYFKVARRNIQDMVPKAIVRFMVDRIQKTLSTELVKELYKKELLDELLEEDPIAAQKRNGCELMLDALKRAVDIIGEIRDSAAY